MLDFLTPGGGFIRESNGKVREAIKVEKKKFLPRVIWFDASGIFAFLDKLGHSKHKIESVIITSNLQLLHFFSYLDSFPYMEI